jgi:hypothetical protein
MDLGCGEYLIISNCIEMPFDNQKLIELLKSIESDIENMNSIVFFNYEPDKINYELVWEGLETFSKNMFDYNDLSKYPLSSIDIKFKNGMVGRLMVGFLDDISYEISFITNYSEAFEEFDNSQLRSRNAEKIEQLAFKMFNSLKPVYGCIGVEIDIYGLRELKFDKSLFPIERVYYSNGICDSNKLFSFGDFQFSKNLTHGIYLRNLVVDEYIYKERSDLKDKIIENVIFKL